MVVAVGIDETLEILCRLRALSTMRVVVHSNVLVSAMRSPHAPPAQVVRLAIQGDLRLLHDARILAEYREGLSRPMHGPPGPSPLTMCGRYRLSIDQQELLSTYVAELFMEAWQPRYNIAPTQTVPVVLQEEGEGRRIEGFRWGLVPSWAKDPAIGNRMINARSETVAEKPSFRGAWRQGRRCLVPANGFYEWQKPLQDKGPTVPHSIQAADGRPFAFAGLWESWNREGETLRTFTILTTEASPGLRRIHNRMPVILGDSEAWRTWLDPRSPGSGLEPLFRPLPDEELHAWPVSTWVNRPGNEGPECMEPVDGEPLSAPET